MPSYLKTIVRAKIERQKLLERIHGRSARLMFRVGAYGMTVMRRMFRPPKSNRGATTLLRTVTGSRTIRGRKVQIYSVNRFGNTVLRQVVVPVGGFGLVRDFKTGRPVSRDEARKARRALQAITFKEGVGKPPRRGPTDLLRQFTLFEAVEERRGVITAVVGPEKLQKQPVLVGARAVPELLDKGGYEEINGQLVKYEPHPFVERPKRETIKRMRQFIAQTPF